MTEIQAQIEDTDLISAELIEQGEITATIQDDEVITATIEEIV